MWEVEGVGVVGTDIATKRYWMERVHGKDLSADFTVVVRVNTIAPIGWDALASVPDILASPDRDMDHAYLSSDWEHGIREQCHPVPVPKYLPFLCLVCH